MAVFRAEYEMNEEIGARLSHDGPSARRISRGRMFYKCVDPPLSPGGAASRLGSRGPRDPGLTAWGWDLAPFGLRTGWGWTVLGLRLRAWHEWLRGPNNPQSPWYNRSMTSAVQTHDSIRAAIKRHWGLTRCGLSRPRRSTPGSGGGIRLSSCLPAGGSRCAIRCRRSSRQGRRCCFAAYRADEGSGGRAQARGVPRRRPSQPSGPRRGVPDRAGSSGWDLKLLLLSPERLLTDRILTLLTRAGIDNFAIDEAHCISQWGA